MALIAYFYRQVTEVQRMSESHTVPTLGVTELVSGLGPGYSSHALYCQAMLPPHQGPPHVGRVCPGSQVRQRRQVEKAQCKPIPAVQSTQAITLEQVSSRETIRCWNNP